MPQKPDTNVQSAIHLRAYRMGWIANRLLSGCGCSGKVLAVVSNAAYLLTDDGELFWIARAGLPAHARAILVPFDETLLNVGMSFTARTARLQIADRVTVDCASAVQWTGRPVLPTRAAPPAVVRDRVCGLRQQCDVGAVLPDSAREIVPVIARACADQDIAAIAALGKGLIGLGVGLTPSGDDFMGGLLFAAHHLRVTYASVLNWRAEPIDVLLDDARTRTNRISYTLLCDQARGDGVEPLHELIAALLGRQNDDDPATHARRVLAIGHTSGVEMLAGVMTGMLLLPP